MRPDLRLQSPPVLPSRRTRAVCGIGPTVARFSLGRYLAHDVAASADGDSSDDAAAPRVGPTVAFEKPSQGPLSRSRGHDAPLGGVGFFAPARHGARTVHRGLVEAEQMNAQVCAVRRRHATRAHAHALACMYGQHKCARSCSCPPSRPASSTHQSPYAALRTRVIGALLQNELRMQ